MPLYESTFIVRQDASPQEVEKVTEKFTKLVKDLKGKVIKKEYWGLRNLAYKISKSRKGHYTMLAIEAPAESIDELLRQYKLSEDVIRNLTVKVANISKDPSPMVEKPAGRRGKATATENEGE